MFASKQRDSAPIMFGLLMRHSKAVNIFISVGLYLLCAVAYLLLILLFLSPQSLHLESLVLVNSDFLKPTVAVGLLSALLTGASSALVTRAVEHSLWLRIANDSARRRELTVKESHRLAQWSVSPLARISYLFTGTSWLLRFSGIFLLATALLNSILLYGISPVQDVSSTQRTLQPTPGIDFAGYLDRSNSLFNGGQFRDILMTIAGQAQMSNVTAPASPLCTNATCHLSASAASLQATCKATTQNNPDGVGTKSSASTQTNTFCSTAKPTLCATLTRNDPATFANFTSDYPADCGSSCAGAWAIIFGAWVNTYDYSTTDNKQINLVECDISFGNVTITQNGTGTPQLDRSTFVKSPYGISTYGSAAFMWHRIYAQSDGDSSPYNFTGSVYGAGAASNLYTNAFATALINYALGYASGAATVARRVEANFDMAALYAFARAPASANVTVTTIASRGVWEYDLRVLLVLLVPLLAKVCVLSVCWRVGGDDVVVGYDPVEISRRGRIRLVGDRDGDHGNVEYVRTEVPLKHSSGGGYQHGVD